MRVSLIVAVAANGVIGRENALPWRLSTDRARFRQLTMGHHLIVGRRTWESIGRPLPGREMIVLSSLPVDLPSSVRRAASLEAALSVAGEAGDDEAFVAGGAVVYELALPLADRIYWTEVQAAVEGDVRFPPFDHAGWKEISRQAGLVDERNTLPHAFLVYERVAAA